MSRAHPTRFGTDGGDDVTALLGPTNTGKTHRAIERMLAHRTGMIGVPLRLLAREIYDKISARKGEHAVALVTGEEKRIPEDPRYWVCTVEAMPTDVPVSFLAVDEVQLAADRTRGHVFTDRILRARGVHETMLLGADTIAPLLERMVPDARVDRQPRFSKLEYTGPKKLGSMPKRTAVVAFSAQDVYAIAERLRAHHGGTAVVLGALSPRARNAQIAMYQAGEVQHIVATDAIGMGLNMDIDHVAFAAVRKFDGVGPRALTSAEIAQIAGRAGRYTRDGTFGTTTDAGPLEDDVVEAVEAHAFPPIDAIGWRNADLDFRTVDGLLTSLQYPSPAAFLIRQRDAEDHRHLEQLASRDEVRERALGEDDVRLLWKVCSVPDFSKTLTTSHTDLLATVYRLLLDKGRLPEEYVARHVTRLDRTEGDIEILMARIAGIRTWTFLTHRRGWIEDARGWQEKAREIEDRLSDALHERLTQRFVDLRTMAVVSPGLWDTRGAIDEDGTVRLGSDALGRMVGFEFRAADARGDRALRRAATTTLAGWLDRRVQRCVEAPFDAFDLDARRFVTWEGSPLARLEPGPSALDPQVRMLRLDLLGEGARERIQRRLEAWVRDLVAPVAGPLDAIEGLSPAARGLWWSVGHALGTVDVESVREQLRAISDDDRKALTPAGLRFGMHRLYVGPLLDPGPIGLRAILWGIWQGLDPLAPPPTPGAVSLPAGDRPSAFWEACGYAVVAGRAVRADVLEAVAGRDRNARRKRQPMSADEAGSRLSCTPNEAMVVLRSLRR